MIQTFDVAVCLRTAARSDHKASPKRRALRPQRMTVPPGSLLTSAAHAVASGTLHVVIHLLSAVASTLSDRFPEGDSGVSISWLDTDRRHSTHWRDYLAHEAISEEALAFNYFVLHRMGPPPLYSRTLLTTGQSIETGLSLLENFLHYKSERGLGTPDSVVLHTPFDLAEWVSGSNLPVEAVSEPYPELPWTAVGLAERRATLTVKQDNADHFQMILHGHSYPYRNMLDSWVGSYLSRDLAQIVEKGTAGATYARFTAPFKAEELPFWIETLQQSCLEVHLDNVSDPQVLQILSSTPHFAVK